MSHVLEIFWPIYDPPNYKQIRYDPFNPYDLNMFFTPHVIDTIDTVSTLYDTTWG